MVRQVRRRRLLRRFGKGILKINKGKIYFGRGIRQRGGGGLSKFISKLVYNIGDTVGI